MISESQKEARKLGIGGSDIAILLGMSSYKTPYQLYLEKIGSLEDKQEESKYQYWGHQLEPLIISEFSKRNNVEIEILDTLTHPEYSFMLGNLDGFIPSWNSVLEVKSSSAFMNSEWGENGSDKIPLQYLLQVAHYCGVKNADNAHIAVLIGGNDYIEFRYQRNFKLESYLIEACKSFWERVQTKTPPDPSNVLDLKLLFPTSREGALKEASQDIKLKLLEIDRIKEESKEISKKEEALKFELIRYLEDSEALTDKDGKILATYKSNKRGTRSLLIKELI